MKKGIVISPKFEPLPNGLQISGDVDTADLRKYLLYWDEIVLAENNLIGIGSNDFDFLQSAGVGRKERVIFQGSFQIDSRIMISSQQAAWLENERKEPGVWSIAQSSSTPFFVDGAIKSVIEFELYDALPIPSHDVPLNDILEFKQKRRDELIAFRVHLDGIYQSVLTAGNIPSAKSAEIEKLKLALNDINRTLSEGLIKKSLSSLRSTFESDFSGVIGTGLAVGAIPGFIPLPPIFAGLAAGGMYLGVKTLMAPNVDTAMKPFNYIKSILREVN